MTTTGIDSFIAAKRNINGGNQTIYRFPNARGASVVCHEFSYGGREGLKELAVIRFDGPGEFEFDLDYSTDITGDVLGWLTDDDVAETLQRILDLPPPSPDAEPEDEPPF